MGRNPNKIKVIKQSRARPRVLWASKYQKVKRVVGNHKIPEESKSLFEYRKRGNTYIDDYLEAKFPFHNEEPSNWSSEVISERIFKDGKPIVEFAGERNGRSQAKALSDRLMVAPDSKFKTVLQDGRFVTIVMVATSKLDCIEFIQYEKHTKQFRVSVTYGSYTRAMEVFHLQTIRWKQSIVIPSVEQTLR